MRPMGLPLLIATCAGATLLTIFSHATEQPASLVEAPSWVRDQQAAQAKTSLIDKLENAENRDRATIAAIQQRLRVVSERNKWLADKYKALKA